MVADAASFAGQLRWKYHWSTQPTTNSLLTSHHPSPSRFKPHSQNKPPKLPLTHPIVCYSAMSCPSFLTQNFPPPSPNNPISQNLKNQLFAPSATTPTSLFSLPIRTTLGSSSTRMITLQRQTISCPSIYLPTPNIQPHSILQPRPPPSHIHCWSLPRLIRNRHLLIPQPPTLHPFPVPSA